MSRIELLESTGKALYGERWQSELARDLGFSDGRRIRQWLSQDRPVPEGICEDLTRLLNERAQAINASLKNLKKWT